MHLYDILKREATIFACIFFLDVMVFTYNPSRMMWMRRRSILITHGRLMLLQEDISPDTKYS